LLIKNEIGNALADGTKLPAVTAFRDGVPRRASPTYRSRTAFTATTRTSLLEASGIAAEVIDGSRQDAWQNYVAHILADRHPLFTGLPVKPRKRRGQRRKRRTER
jgi:hypothetical protein